MTREIAVRCNSCGAYAPIDDGDFSIPDDWEETERTKWTVKHRCPECKQ